MTGSGAAHFVRLLTSRRFAPLFWCQFLSAFNDNFVRNMLAMLILFRLAPERAGLLITLGVAIFILPSIFLSGLGGELADAHDKAWVTRRLKGAEIGVQLVAALGLWLTSLPLLYAALLGLGVIAALFGPIKYGILPDHLDAEELLPANGLIEAATFLAILLGLIAGGLSMADGRSPLGVTIQLGAIALACFVTSLFIPPTAPNALKVERNVLTSTRRLIGALRADGKLWRPSLAVSWFWLVGALALSLAPVAIRRSTGGDVGVETAVSGIFAVGIGVGSLVASLVARDPGDLRLVPPAALGMAVFLIDLGVATHGPAAGATASLAAVLASAEGWRLAIDVLGLAAASGLFAVPLSAAIQHAAPKERRARVIGGLNALNALFMVAGSLAATLLQSPLIDLSGPMVLVLLGLATLAVAAGTRRLTKKAPM